MSSQSFRLTENRLRSDRDQTRKTHRVVHGEHGAHRSPRISTKVAERNCFQISSFSSWPLTVTMAWRGH